MITRTTIKEVLADYLMGQLSPEEISSWANQMINEEMVNGDELVIEVLYNLVSFHKVGIVYDQYRHDKDKLEYLMHWLDGDKECNWEQYTSIFDPNKLC